MKFSASIADLKTILPIVSAAVPSRSTLQQLENIQLELKSKRLTMMATDLEVSVRSSIEVAAKTDGVIAANAKRLGDFIKSLPDGDLNATLDKTTRRLQLQSAQGNYTMATFAESDLPDMMKEFKPEGTITANGGDLKKMISTAVFAASSNEFRAAMMGLLFQFSPDGTTCVATDGHRLVKITNPELKSDTERDVIIPAKAVNLVAKSFSDSDTVTISFSPTQIEFKNDSTSILSRLIDEQYPNYEAVIPRENEKTMTISRSSLASSNKRVLIFASPDTSQVRLELRPNKLTILADDADEGANGEEFVPCDYSGDELLIGFNGKFIDEALSHIDTDEITMKFSTPTRAAIIEPRDSGNFETLMLVMPVRLSA
ncbi:MAG TPA: DNA polymerase III subunit beta [Candidatus Kapabacteria bacterium]|nr:DNA polymerase III subunit beta [Candidatus Kapabacteria bacterium]